MDGLGLVTLRQWQQHKLRLALTIVGVALGVAVFFAVRSTTLTLVDSLNSTIEKLAGKSTLQIAAGDTGFPIEFLQVARETPGVKFAEPVTETIVETIVPVGEKILVLGLVGLVFIVRHDALLIGVYYDPPQGAPARVSEP